MAATRAHTAPSQGPARRALLAVCSPPALPVGSLSALHLLSAQQGLGLLRRPPHMTCGESFIVEGAPWGGCSLRAGPAHLPPVRYFPLTLTPRTAEKMAEVGSHHQVGGRPFSLSPEALGGLKSSQTDPSPDPTKATQVLSSDGANSITSWRHPRKMDHTKHAVLFKFYHFSCYSVAVMHTWFLGLFPEA